MYKRCPNCGHWNSEWSNLPEQCVKCANTLPKKTQAEIELENCAKEIEAIKAKYPDVIICGNSDGEVCLYTQDKEKNQAITKIPNL